MKEIIKLTEIRNELLLGVENKDLLYIKMQINKIDTLIYKITKNNEKSIMDICAKQGTKVIVTEDSIKNGYDSVEKHARQHLEIGKTYTIANTDVDGWNTNVYLEEFPNEVFNSVSFVNKL